jgi:hypothetical protein
MDDGDENATSPGDKAGKDNRQDKRTSRACLSCRARKSACHLYVTPMCGERFAMRRRKSIAEIALMHNACQIVKSDRSADNVDEASITRTDFRMADQSAIEE